MLLPRRPNVARLLHWPVLHPSTPFRGNPPRGSCVILQTDRTPAPETEVANKLLGPPSQNAATDAAAQLCGYLAAFTVVPNPDRPTVCH